MIVMMCSLRDASLSLTGAATSAFGGGSTSAQEGPEARAATHRPRFAAEHGEHMVRTGLERPRASRGAEGGVDPAPAPADVIMRSQWQTLSCLSFLRRAGSGSFAGVGPAPRRNLSG